MESRRGKEGIGMKILILGGGGREHAVVWALARSGLAPELHAAPGNPGIAGIGETHPLDPCDAGAVVALAKRLRAELIVPGPEAPLVAGVADTLREEGFPVLGPGRSGARLEGSKAFSKRFLDRCGIPTAPFDVCADMAHVEAALAGRSAPFIVKADGLAAGKGVFVCADREEARAAAEGLLAGGLGEAGRTLVIEDFLPGRELSVLALIDGKTARLFPESQDHKRALDGDRGPNTGGMGAYAPVPWVDETLLDRIREDVFGPVLRGLEREGIDYRGILYAGLMIDRDGTIRVLEFNVRMGDPETQAILPILPWDLGEAALACASGDLKSLPEATRPTRSACCVVLAGKGYPESSSSGLPVEGLDPGRDGELHGGTGVLVFHAGTRRDASGTVVTAGGRILSVVGVAEDFEGARCRAYDRISSLSYAGMRFRTDIAAKARG
jgi:phosphoribosylamine--glycine ligase